MSLSNDLSSSEGSHERNVLQPDFSEFKWELDRLKTAKKFPTLRRIDEDDDGSDPAATLARNRARWQHANRPLSAKSNSGRSITPTINNAPAVSESVTAESAPAIIDEEDQENDSEEDVNAAKPVQAPSDSKEVSVLSASITHSSVPAQPVQGPVVEVVSSSSPSVPSTSSLKDSLLIGVISERDEFDSDEDVPASKSGQSTSTNASVSDPNPSLSAIFPKPLAPSTSSASVTQSSSSAFLASLSSSSTTTTTTTTTTASSSSVSLLHSSIDTSHIPATLLQKQEIRRLLVPPTPHITKLVCNVLADNAHATSEQVQDEFKRASAPERIGSLLGLLSSGGAELDAVINRQRLPEKIQQRIAKVQSTDPTNERAAGVARRLRDLSTLSMFEV